MREREGGGVTYSSVVAEVEVEGEAVEVHSWQEIYKIGMRVVSII